MTTFKRSQAPECARIVEAFRAEFGDDAKITSMRGGAFAKPTAG